MDRLLDELNVSNDPDRDEDYISVQAYAGFYRILYNASYLSKEMSERALIYLSYEDFKEGILAGIPKGLPVASKFGERALGPNYEIKQLHEFGIVYYPGRPYLIGIMTRGRDFDKLKTVLRDISRLIYEEIDRQGTGNKEARAASRTER
jgi:beta-lactamase class A